MFTKKFIDKTKYSKFITFNWSFSPLKCIFYIKNCILGENYQLENYSLDTSCIFAYLRNTTCNYNKLIVIKRKYIKNIFLTYFFLLENEKSS